MCDSLLFVVYDAYGKRCCEMYSSFVQDNRSIVSCVILCWNPHGAAQTQGDEIKGFDSITRPLRRFDHVPGLCSYPHTRKKQCQVLTLPANTEKAMPSFETTLIHEKSNAKFWHYPQTRKKKQCQVLKLPSYTKKAMPSFEIIPASDPNGRFVTSLAFRL